MILIVVVAGPVGWEANRVGRMQRAVAILQRPVAGEPPTEKRAARLRGRVDLAPKNRVRMRYDDTWRDGKFQEVPRFAWIPRWIRAGVGPDHWRWVTRLDMDRRPTPEDWEAIAALGTVTDLRFWSPNTTDADLARLAECPNLEVIDLNSTPTTDAVLGPISRLPSLRELDLGPTKVSERGVAALAGMSHLQSLRFMLTAEAKADATLAQLRGLTQLRTLSIIGGEGVTDAGLASLAGMLSLERLTLGTAQLTEVGVARLVALPRLRALSIFQIIHLPPVLPESFSGFDFNQPWLSPGGAEEFARLRNLEVLSLFTLPSNDACLRAIGQLTELRELEVGGDAITDAGVAALGNLTHLRELTLTAPRLTDTGLAALGRLRNLEVLNLEESKALTAQGLTHLQGLGRLDSLTLPSQVSPDEIAQFQAARSQQAAGDPTPAGSPGSTPKAP